MRKLVLLVVATALIGSSSPPPARSPEAQAKLDKWLGGRVAGQGRNCLPADKANSPIGIDDHTMLFRDGPRIWRNELKAGQNCGDLGARRALMATNRSMRLCSSDTVHIIDLNDGSGVGGCMLGEFVPYTKAKR